MSINALNSGAKVWMADFEDATSPSWSNVIDGQINLYDAIRRQLDFTDAEDGKEYKVGEHPDDRGAAARLAAVREAHLASTGARCRPRWSTSGCSSSTTRSADRQRCRPVLLPAEAGVAPRGPAVERRLRLAQELLGIPQGTIRATVLIETLPAAFEMEEILYELRDHSSGLNAGRWDYIFSYIKTFAQR